MSHGMSVQTPPAAATGTKVKLVCSDEPAAADIRVIEWMGIAVDVRCVTRVEIISAAEMAEEFRTTGRGLPHCTDDVAVVRYSNGEVTGGLYVEVLTPELHAQLVARFTHEIQDGTDPRIDLYRLAWDLEMAFQSHPSRRRSKNHPSQPEFLQVQQRGSHERRRNHPTPRDQD